MTYAPSSVPGVFLGYHFHANGKWKGEYVVISLSDLKRGIVKGVQRTMEIVVADPVKYRFPMSELSDPHVQKWTEEFSFLNDEERPPVNKSAMTD